MSIHSKNITKLSTEPYKGTRDFYPKDMAVQNYIFSTMRSVVERFGYQEYAASILESTDLYRAKSGEEIINDQTYSFIDRGGRDVTIRPEMTPTVARMVARKTRELHFPLRWYSIPNLWRYERPQRGRLREHFQLNVDMFGVDSIYSELEIIQVAHQIMKAFGAQEDQFIIKINSRKIVNSLFREYFKLDQAQQYTLSKLIDRKNKISEADFRIQSEQIVGSQTDQFMNMLESPTLDSLQKTLETSKFDDSAQELKTLLQKLQSLGIKNIQFDLSLMRGFDYYTGIVFEVFDTNPENRRSLFGGGRYDNLVDMFGGQSICGVGFGMGDVTIKDFLETHNLLPQNMSMIDIFMACMDVESLNHAFILADTLRDQGISIVIDPTLRKVGTQIKTAVMEEISYVIVIGQEEIKNQKYTLKNLKTEQAQELYAEELISMFKK